MGIACPTTAHSDGCRVPRDECPCHSDNDLLSIALSARLFYGCFALLETGGVWTVPVFFSL